MTVPGPYGDQTTDALLAAQGYIPAQQGEFLGRILDPVRAKALHEAVRWAAWIGDTAEFDRQVTLERILEVARTFEGYLDPETE